MSALVCLLAALKCSVKLQLRTNLLCCTCPVLRFMGWKASADCIQQLNDSLLGSDLGRGWRMHVDARLDGSYKPTCHEHHDRRFETTWEKPWKGVFHFPTCQDVASTFWSYIALPLVMVGAGLRKTFWINDRLCRLHLQTLHYIAGLGLVVQTWSWSMIVFNSLFECCQHVPASDISH